AGVGLGARRAPVVEAAHRSERLFEDRVALAALHVDHEPHATAVVLEARVVETLRGGEVGVREIASAVAIGRGRGGHDECRPLFGRSARLVDSELATAGRHWPVGGPEIVAGRPREWPASYGDSVAGLGQDLR